MRVYETKKKGWLKERISKCADLRAQQGGGRPKKSLLTTLRTKAWAHYCAMEVGSDKHASSGIIAKSILPDRKDVDNGNCSVLAANWRKYLSRSSGVSEGNVDYLDNLWPGSGKIFHHGPFVKKSAYIGDFNFPEDGGHIPLWAAIKGDSFRTRKDNYEKQPFLRDLWRNIFPYSWFLWSPWMLPYDPQELCDFESNHILGNDQKWHSPPPKTAVVNGETHQYSMTNHYWHPSSKNFRDNEALADLLFNYANNPACYPETPALVCLTACISISRIRNESLCVLPPLFSCDDLASELIIYNISFQDIIAAACDFGLTILTTDEYHYLVHESKELADQSSEHDSHQDHIAFEESLEIREDNKFRNQKYKFFSIDHTRPTI